MSNYSKINYHQGNVIPDVLPSDNSEEYKVMTRNIIKVMARDVYCHCEPSIFALQEPTVNDPPIRWQKVRGKYRWICTNCELERVKSSVIFTESIKVQKENVQKENPLDRYDREYALMREQRLSERTETFGYSNCLDRLSQLPNVKNIELCGSSGLVFEYWN